MEITDAITFGQFAVNRGLITPQQLTEAMEEAREKCGKAVPDLYVLSGVMEGRGMITGLHTSKLMKGDPDGYFMGGYRINYKIQSGSFGRVFRAEERGTGRVVAVKVLRRRWSEDQQRIDLFVREGRVGMSLRHPNIVEVLAINQDAKSRQYYIAMEFVEGGNLREILQLHKKLPLDRALGILEDCAAGLAHAYSRGITHRDVKLTNILISTSFEAKLVDFGLAQMFASMAREEEHIDRTVDYAGLEKLTGVKYGDERSDIFFLGCVFYECLTGRPPLEMTKDRHMRMSRKRFEECLQLKPSDVEGPPSLFTLSETMMALDPVLRFQTPAQLLDAVRNVRREVGAPPRPRAAGEAPEPEREKQVSVYLVEGSPRLADKMRDGLKALGYRVFLAGDPVRALERFRQQPYDALVVDAGTVGEDGLFVFGRIFEDARAKGIRIVGLLILNEDQADWVSRLPRSSRIGVHIRPAKLNLQARLQELFKARAARDARPLEDAGR
jgi:tRNA A-37 threonylcarbamoyl transferase component Bud32